VADETETFGMAISSTGTFCFLTAALLLISTHQLTAEVNVQQKWVRSISQAISDLGSPSFQTRESASRKLSKIGSLALMPILRATQSKDPEAASRAVRIVTKMETDDAFAFHVLSKMAAFNTKQSLTARQIIRSPEVQAGKPARIWIQVNPMAHAHLPIDRDPDAWWRKYVMSEKARSIEKNLGFQ
jgi:hypothetical protein